MELNFQPVPNAVCPTVLTGNILSGQTNYDIFPDQLCEIDTGVFKNHDNI